MRAIGLMSGTSLDGVDIALLDTDGKEISAFGPAGYRAYSDDERALLRQALADAATLSERGQRPGSLREAEAMVTAAHGQAVAAFLADNGLGPTDIDVIGFHGQTVLHRPERRLTVQIGDGAELARMTQCNVVYDLRAADVAAGGQGAPFVPVYHEALARRSGLPLPVCVINIGGVANLTFVHEGDPIACDTGPGNALIDDFMLQKRGEAMDKDGAFAARGKVDEAFVTRVLAQSYFHRPPPKSLDRNDFSLASLALPDLTEEDGAATLAAITVGGIARAMQSMPSPPKSVIICGGGAHNQVLVGGLGMVLAPAAVRTASEAGWASDSIEAQAFAFLAVRCLRGLPLSFPTTTGVLRPLSGGVLAKR